ncbi:MAG: NAD(P)-dependent oxidoreductase [Anaerolineae bacterium]|nr:NAD(P)-dependent oxidoreductase [Anaerolineae bacterium]
MTSTSVLKGKRVFVTGATGFIGGALALRLCEIGARVVGLARSPAKGAFLAAAGVEVVQGDVTDFLRLHQVMAGDIDVVFHLAAIAGAGLSAQMQKVNVEGTRNVLEAARAAHVGRFVHVSTMSVYGYRRSGVVDETARLGDTGDMYGDTKALGEGLVQRSGLPWTIVRPGQVYGPRSPSWSVRMLQATRRFVPLIDSGRGSCHPIYIDDLVDLVALAGAHPGAVGEIFNGTPDPACTWLAFLDAYARMHNQTWHVDISRSWVMPPVAVLDLLLLLSGRRLPLRAMVEFITGDVTYSNRKARAVLGWEPQVSLQAGMRRTELWFRAEGYLP